MRVVEKKEKLVDSQSTAASRCVSSFLNDEGIMKAPHPSFNVAGLSWMNQNGRKNVPPLDGLTEGSCGDKGVSDEERDASNLQSNKHCGK